MSDRVRSARRQPLRVLVVGAGVAGLETVMALRELAEERVVIELLSEKPEYVDRPLAVAEPFGVSKPQRYDLGRIAGDCGASLRVDGLEAVDTKRRRVRTRAGARLEYDVLVIAVGATPGVALAGVVTIKGPGYTARFRTVLLELQKRRIRRVTFAVPPGATWPLPLYELALMTAARVSERGLRKVELRLVTPEAAPLELFGSAASAAVARLLEQRGIELHASAYPASVEADGLHVVPAAAGPVPAERVVALPALSGPEIPGLPRDPDGFIPVDVQGQVQGEVDVYAAGDATSFPIKQGGIASQQADAVAEAIAARAGASITPRPFQPVLRGMLLTGGAPRYMRAEIAGGRGEEWQVSEHALWWPPAKVAGRYLTPYLALHQGAAERETPTEGTLPVELRLEQSPATGIRRRAVVIAGAPDGRFTALEVRER